MARSRPYVIVSAAISIDGKMATRTGRSDLSSKKDLIRVHGLRSAADAILVGRNTVDVDDPMLTVRHVRGKNPVRVILDPKGRLSARSKVLRTARETPTILVMLEGGAKGAGKLAATGVEVVRCGRKEIDLERLLKILWGRGIKKILVEGGGATNWHFFEQGLVDEIVVAVTPYVLGGKNATSLADGMGFDRIPAPFRLKDVKRIKNELVLRYVP